MYTGIKCQYKEISESGSIESRQWLRQIGIDRNVCLMCVGYLNYVTCDKFRPKEIGGIEALIHGR